VIFPLLTTLIVVAPTLVPWLYGDKWAPAAEAAQILAVAGFVATIGTGTGPLMMALGKPGALMSYNGAALVIFSAVLLIAAPHGLTVTCVSVAGFRLVSLVGTQYLLVERLGGIPLKQTLFRDVAPAALCCAVQAGAAFAILSAAEQLGAPALVLLIAVGVGGLATYGVALRYLFPTTWRDLLTVLERIAPAGARRRVRLPAALASRTGG
jgi:lipopolysaccharide exporter